MHLMRAKRCYPSPPIDPGGRKAPGGSMAARSPSVVLERSHGGGGVNVFHEVILASGRDTGVYLSYER